MATKLSSADQTNLTKAQQAQITEYKKQWEAASAAGDTAGMEAAHKGAEAVRATAGYSGGADGSGNTRISSYGGGQTAEDVQNWVDRYNYYNYSGKNGWVNGYSDAMNHRSIANYIRQQMEANSNAWADADAEGKAYLHEQNVKLAQVLSDAVGGVKSVYNEELGRWETDNANYGYGYNTGGYRDVEWAKEQYGMTDEQIESYRNDTARYHNFVDQGIIRNWYDESSGFTGEYAQFVNGPYGQLLGGTVNVPSAVYRDEIGDDFMEKEGWKPEFDAEGNILPRQPGLKNNNTMSDYTRKFASYTDDNGIIHEGQFVLTNPGGGKTGEVLKYEVPSMPSAEGTDLGAILGKWQDSAAAQAISAHDYAVTQAVQALLQAQAQAQTEYQTRRDQISKEERNALDNAALYAQTRGDRGGIGQSQYNQIHAQADANRQAVATAQTQLAADTAQQIARLRADGEFEKADELMEISQTYLLKLLSMEQWAAEYRLDVARFEESIRQWENEYQLSLAKALI